ncbi:hypothetical protein SLS62_004348 [Diatrype stigma]|uniref:SGNH hydrolase-type esterase domain-containing protein n=1 Tax=Diatrype stigma TaxID=117547 RepID=A0AAN9YTI0_9PEZI
MSRPRLRILCFGDSLTAGWPSGHPYGGKLEEKLEAALPHLRPICEVDGVPGDKVAYGSYRKRMERAWQPRGASTASSGSGTSADHRRSTGSSSSGSRPSSIASASAATATTNTAATSGDSNKDEPRSRPEYDWTIVLGGTNDLAWKVVPTEVVDGLRRTWDVALSRGGKVLALTIPEAGGGYFPEVDAARDEINEGIRAYKRPGFFYFDLHAALPYLGMPPAKRSRIWEGDGVHLTEAGYDYMGEKIAEALTRIVRLAEAQDTEISSLVPAGVGGAAATARQRRAIEQLILLEEERGDPRLLSQGYIVVRKADLD